MKHFFINLVFCLAVYNFLPKTTDLKESILIWIFTTFFVTVFEHYQTNKIVKNVRLNESRVNRQQYEIKKNKGLIKFHTWQIILKGLIPNMVGFFYAYLKDILIFFFVWGHGLIFIICSLTHVVLLFAIKKYKSWIYYLFWVWTIIYTFKFGLDNKNDTINNIVNYYSVWAGLLNFLVEALEILENNLSEDSRFKKVWDKFWNKFAM